MTANELDLMLKTLVSIADEAGCEILKHYKSDLSHNKKSDGSPITLADIAANKIITSNLRLNWPNIYILSEEDNYSQNKISGCKSYWAVDPLDGTKEFLKQNDEFTVNIALVNKGMPILGLIYAPALKLMYIGSLFGTRIFRKRIDNYWIDLMKEKSYSRKTNNLLIAISRSHPSADLDKWLKTIKNFETIQIGSSLKFCSVAEGLVDLYPRYGNTHIWDTAAGHAIINASGGVINNLKNEKLIYSDNLINGYFIAKSSYFLKSPMRF